MNEGLLSLLDTLLAYSLQAFLILFLVALLYARRRLRRRKTTIADYYREKFRRKEKDEAFLPPPSPRRQWKIVFNALLFSAVLAGFFFLVLSFTPLPGVENFVTVHSWRVTPLRVTALLHERTQHGFALEGEVWNQTEGALPALTAVVAVWGQEDEILDEITVPVRPDPLPPGRPGQFSLQYKKNSPFLKGYQIRFRSPEGETVPHVMGFDVP